MAKMNEVKFGAVYDITPRVERELWPEQKRLVRPIQDYGSDRVLCRSIPRDVLVDYPLRHFTPDKIVG